MEQILCAYCDQPISEKRLKIKPNTKICVSCQQDREERGEFQRSSMEISQDINGWQFDGLDLKIKKGE
jgi:hypothetical protein